MQQRHPSHPTLTTPQSTQRPSGESPALPPPSSARSSALRVPPPPPPPPSLRPSSPSLPFSPPSLPLPESFLPPAAPSLRRHDGLLAALRAAPPWVPWLVAVLVTGAALYGVVWGYGVRARLLEQAEKAEAAAVAAAAARQSVERELAPLKADKAGIASEKASLAAARASLTRDLQVQAGQEAALKTAADRLRETMKREIAQGDVHLAQSKGRLQVGVVDRILFERSTVSLSARGEGVLARVGAALGGSEGWQIQVSGHTDNTPVAKQPAAALPQQLGAVARAQCSRRALPARTGRDPARPPGREWPGRVPAGDQQPARRRPCEEPPHRAAGDARVFGRGSGRSRESADSTQAVFPLRPARAGRRGERDCSNGSTYAPGLPLFLPAGGVASGGAAAGRALGVVASSAAGVCSDAAAASAVFGRVGLERDPALRGLR